MERTWKFDLQLFADPNAGGDNGGDNPDGQGEKAGDVDGSKGDEGKAFTQAELEEILKRRLARERKQWEAQLEEERKKQQMSAEERLKAEKEAAEKRAQEALQQANQRAIRAEAKAQAAALGVRPDRLEYVLRLANLSSVEVGEDGEPDAKAVKAAIEEVLKALPELKGGGGSVGAGSNPGDRSPGKIDIRNMSPEEFRKLQQRVLMGERIQL